ncbi:YflJ family protein [Bacillus sp. YC2]|nr:YflJ family protein [Bacillus sp. YC2]MBY8914426.1 YflJ family protein [Bacillus sp. YC2]
MHYGSKGWYVAELKKKGITEYEGRKLQSFKTYFLANLLKTKK